MFFIATSLPVVAPTAGNGRHFLYKPQLSQVHAKCLFFLYRFSLIAVENVFEKVTLWFSIYTKLLCSQKGVETEEPGRI